MIKWMIRWTWRTLLVLLLAASIWVVVIWIRSFVQAEWYQSAAMYDTHWRPGAAIRAYAYEVDSGGVCFQTQRIDLPDLVSDADLAKGTVHEAYGGRSKPGGYPKGPQFSDGYPVHVNRLGFGYLKLPGALTRTFTIFPLWAVVAALDLLPGMWLAVKLFRLVRPRRADTAI